MTAEKTENHGLLEALDCPYCDKKAKLTPEPNEVVFKGTTYVIIQYVYHCGNKHHSFYTEASLTKTVGQITGYLQDNKQSK